PVPIRALVPAPKDVPPGLEAIVLKCLSKRPEHRYQSMGELIVEFDKLAAGGVPDAVPEMMSRSGGFNVPVDYFKKGQMPEPMPASPSEHPGARGSKWPVYAGIAGVLAAIAIVVGIFAKSQQSSATPTPPVVAEVAAPKPLEPAVSVAAPAPAPVAIASKEVAIAVEPIDAHVFRDGTDLGPSPVMVAVETGKTVDLEIDRDGYKPQKITLDGAKTREVVKLVKAPHAAGAAFYHPAPAKRPDSASPAPKKPKTGIGGSEIVNPWGN
ncbi:MAG TPA: serine/threonine protein kinase, partial [Polyangiaceae bacterium]